MKKSFLKPIMSGAFFGCAFVLAKKYAEKYLNKEGVADFSQVESGSDAYDAPRQGGDGASKVISKKKTGISLREPLPFVKFTIALDYPDVTLPNSSPIIRNDRTLMPMVALAEAMGLQAVWDEAEMTASLRNSAHIIELQAGSNILIVDGREVYTDSPAIIFDEIVYVPVRIIAETLGCRVEWHDFDRIITIIAP
ncbi:MAG: copper amine oxidase N-terminal domain-containing protein [Clostridiales bacterium]|jgi:hypothetical protein|nr:copper amine oxidase N-terminal domain-containing protein [Clostridiales bacterium]